MSNPQPRTQDDRSSASLDNNEAAPPADIAGDKVDRAWILRRVDELKDELMKKKASLKTQEKLYERDKRETSKGQIDKLKFEISEVTRHHHQNNRIGCLPS